MFQRTLVAAAAIAAGVLIIAAPATAAPTQTETGTCAIGVVQATPHAGDTITVTGTNFPTVPATRPTTIDNPSQQIGTAHINGSGQFSDQAKLPANLATGAHTISVSCATTGLNTTTTINVGGKTDPKTDPKTAAQPDPASSSGSPLPRTGTDVEPLVLAGLGAVAVGAALVLTARRRRAQRLTI